MRRVHFFLSVALTAFGISCLNALCTQTASAAAVPLRILVIAGQSNAINIHADAKGLPAALVDTTVRFYYHCGLLPNRNIPFFSTSANRWTTLSIQRQVPYQGRFEYFFGPEMTLVNSLAGSGGSLAVIKCAYAGSGLADDWKRGAVKGNKLYATMMDQIANACRLLDSAGVSYVFAGFFWIQGEQDASVLASSQAYLPNLTELIKGVRTDLNAPHMPVVISRLPSRQPYAYLAAVRSAQEKAAATIEAVRCVDTDSLELDTDNVHFLASSVLKLGRLLASAWNLTDAAPETDRQAVRSFSLGQNFPNPFNPSTMIVYTLSERRHVRLSVSDMLGRERAILVDGVQSAGAHSIRFDGSLLPAGIYFYSLRAGDYGQTRKSLLLK